MIGIITVVLVVIGASQIDAHALNLPVEPYLDTLPPLISNHLPNDDSSSKTDEIGYSNGINWRIAKNFNGPNCPPEFVGAPPNCTAIEYILEPIQVKICPNGTFGTPPNCHKPCPPYHVGLDDSCTRARCPPGSEGEFQPDCKFTLCPAGTIGFYPNCFNFTINGNGTEYCPDGQVGTPPYCHIPCPPYTYGIYPDCKKLKCPPGFIGEFMPDCKTEAKCPAGYEGTFPHCRKLYCPTGYVGQWPHCTKPKCVDPKFCDHIIEKCQPPNCCSANPYHSIELNRCCESKSDPKCLPPTTVRPPTTPITVTPTTTPPTETPPVVHPRCEPPKCCSANPYFSIELNKCCKSKNDPKCLPPTTVRPPTTPVTKTPPTEEIPYCPAGYVGKYPHCTKPKCADPKLCDPPVIEKCEPPNCCSANPYYSIELNRCCKSKSDPKCLPPTTVRPPTTPVTVTTRTTPITVTPPVVHPRCEPPNCCSANPYYSIELNKCCKSKSDPKCLPPTTARPPTTPVTVRPTTTPTKVTPPTVSPSCPPGTTGAYPKCCPFESEHEWPQCGYCQSGYSGIYPDCVKIKCDGNPLCDTPLKCKEGFIAAGNPQKCRKICVKRCERGFIRSPEGCIPDLSYLPLITTPQPPDVDCVNV